MRHFKNPGYCGKSILLIICLVSGLMTLGQERFSAGLMAGGVAAQISGDGLAGWDKLGITGGAWVRANLSEKWSVTSGLQYIQKGSRTKRDTLNFQTFAFKLNYIDVPLMAGYQSKKWRFNLGLYAGVLVSQKIVANGYDYEPNPPFENYDIGSTGGVVFALSESWAIEARGQFSIIPTRPTPNFTNPGSYYEKGNYNQTLQFMIHFAF